MTGYLKLEAIVDKEADVEANFKTLVLSDGEILSVVSWLHYSVIESVAKNLGLNAEETNNKIRQIIMQSSDAPIRAIYFKHKKGGKGTWQRYTT